MAKYEVLAEVELEGTVQAVGSQVELAEDVAAPLVENGTLKAVEAAAAE